MTLDQRVDKLEAYFGKHDDMVRELRDAVTVTAQLEARHSTLMKEHSVWLVRHEKALEGHDEAMQRLDERIADLVSAIGKLIPKQ